MRIRLPLTIALLVLALVVAGQQSLSTSARGAAFPRGAASEPAGDRSAPARALPAAGVAGAASAVLSAVQDGASTVGDAAAQLAGSAQSSVAFGGDGRLTVLLVGSDYTPARNHDYIDAVFVMSLHPTTKQVTAVHIPRYVTKLPRAPINGGGTFSGLLSRLYASYSNVAPAQVDRTALLKVKRDIAYALGIEIDYWAYTRFTGLTAMVNELSGVSVGVPATIYDPYYGAYFPASSSYGLHGDPPCTLDAACRSALRFVRTRKGTVGGARNSDRSRNYRQQDLVMAAVRRVTGGDGTGLAALEVAANSQIETSMPHGLADAQYLYRLLKGAYLPASRRIVLDVASGYAYKAPGSTGDRPKIILYTSSVRALCDRWFTRVT